MVVSCCLHCLVPRGPCSGLYTLLTLQQATKLIWNLLADEDTKFSSALLSSS